MKKILMKLKNNSEKQFITTMSGYTIIKEQFVPVDEEDLEIQALIYNRDDLDLKEFIENIVDNNIKSETFKE